MYKQIKPSDVPRRRSELTAMAEKDVQDFGNATGIHAAQVVIPAGKTAKSVAASYKSAVKRLEMGGCVKVILINDQVYMIDPRTVMR